MTQSTLLPSSAPSPVNRSSNRSRQIILAVFVVSFLTILARAAISAAKAEMARDLRIDDIQFGMIFGAFALGYAAFMLPCGLLADRWGPRKSLALSVFFWGLFTLLTGLASEAGILIVIRLLFGMAEAGVYPQATRALYNWIAPRGRGLALSLLNMGSRFGAAFGLAATPWFIWRLGWRQSFVWLGVLGTVWSIVWLLWFRDRPADAPHPQEAAMPTGATKTLGIPWQAFATSRNFYLILYQYFASQFTFFICLSWLMPFLSSRYGITVREAGVLASIPLCFGALSMWIGGAATDHIFKAGHWKRSRALPSTIGFGLAAAALIVAPFMPSSGWFIAIFALTTCGVDLSISPSWAVSCDVGGSYSGTLSAAMNTMGALGSLSSSLLFPLLIRWTGDVRLYFGAAALLNIIALICWRFIDPSKSLLPQQRVDAHCMMPIGAEP